MGDLPDYTKSVSVDVTVTPDVSFIASISEGKEKSFKEWNLSSAGTCTQIAPASGKGIYLLIIFANAQTDGDSYTVEYLVNSVWTKLIDAATLWANGHFYNTYPYFYLPSQDEGDGSTNTFRITCAGSGPWVGHVVYIEDDPPSS